jgi:excisionase family DNA binding protein
MELISSRQAANLLGVHESSIKRWCNDDEMSCEYTAGGHRRISLHEVMQFARAQGMDCLMLPFDKDAPMIWNGAKDLKSGGSADILKVKLREWLLQAESARVNALFRLCRSLGIGLPTLFDRLLGGVMWEIGDSWARGTFEVGEEHRVSECVIDLLYGLKADIAHRNGTTDRRTAIVGCGAGEDHVIGALMIRILLLERGWNVVFLGRDVPEEDILLFQRRHAAQLVCISMSSRREPAEVAHYIRSLVALRRADHPFDLAIGGSGAGLLEKSFFFSERNGVVKLFDSTNDFSDWIERDHG